MPWLFIPVLLLTSVRLFDAGIIWGFHFDTLFLPMAAWLGFRYGTKGLVAVAIACSVLVFQYTLISSKFGNLLLGYQLGVPLAGIGLAWLCASPKNWQRVGRVLTANPRAIWMLPLLPTAVYLSFPWTNHSFGFESFAFEISDGFLAYTAMFVLGFLGGRIRQLLLPLLVMLALSIAAKIINDHLREFYYELSTAHQSILGFRYLFSNNIPESILCFLAGTWTSIYLSSRTKPFERYRYGLPVLLAALVVFSYFEFSFHKDYDPGAFFKEPGGFHPIGHLEVFLTGGFFALVIAAFLAGLVYGKLGYLTITCFVIGYALFMGVVDSQWGILDIASGFSLDWKFRNYYTLSRLPALLIWVFVGDKVRKLYDNAKPRENSPHPCPLHVGEGV